MTFTTHTIPAEIVAIERESAECLRMADNAREGRDYRSSRILRKHSRDLYREYRRQLVVFINSITEA